MRIILASSSPRRKDILYQMGFKFEVITSRYNEEMNYSLDHEEIAINHAYNKAMDIRNLIDYDAVIIGADTIVVKDGILGKPKDRLDAYEMLKRLQGSCHYVITGLCVMDTRTNNIIKAYEKTQVEMSALSEDDINAYINTGEPFDKAGSYGIQGLAGKFIKRIDGCYFNVVGLPMNKLWTILKSLGIS